MTRVFVVLSNGIFKSFLPPNALDIELRELNKEEIIELMSEAGWSYDPVPQLYPADITLVTSDRPETSMLAFNNN